MYGTRVLFLEIDVLNEFIDLQGSAVKRVGDGKLEGDLNMAGTGKGLKAILNGLEDLWDQSQYTEEYNLGHFLEKLNG